MVRPSVGRDAKLVHDRNQLLQPNLSSFMQIAVKGKQIDVGDALRGHIETSLRGTVSKYFDRAIEANVAVARRAHLFRADISVHIGRGMLLQGHGEEVDAYAAFDAACERIDKRLRRYKRWLRDHRKSRDERAETIIASQYVLAGAGESEETEPGANPVIVAEMSTEIDTLTVGEAVMRMDLADLSAMMFRNRAHGGLNMVYRRSDGHVGWIDPQGAQQSAKLS
jgi:ribosomal subunit interface protein